MYNEVDDPKKQTVKVETATLAVDDRNPFHERIAGLIDPATDLEDVFASDGS